MAMTIIMKTRMRMKTMVNGGIVMPAMVQVYVPLVMVMEEEL